MKIRFGDIIELRTSKGLAYALYTHRHPRYGAMLRVFDQVFMARPDDFHSLLGGAVRFTTFFPLQAAADKGIVEIVENVPVPEHLKAFPLFRAGAVDPRTKKVSVWWLWDGDREWQIGDLASDQRKLPIRGVLNDTLLIKRIEEEWRPENDLR